jgi:hypothetical protein
MDYLLGNNCLRIVYISSKAISYKGLNVMEML